MKSFDQLAKAAYLAWHKSHETDRHMVPFERLDSTFRAHWIAVVQAIAEEMATLH